MYTPDFGYPIIRSWYALLSKFACATLGPKKVPWAYAKIKQSLCKKSLRTCVTRVDVTYLNIYYLIKQTKLAAVYYVISNASATFEYFPWNEPSFFLVFNARRICGIKDSRIKLFKIHTCILKRYIHKIVHQK